MSTTRGFTLIELLVVIAIIGVLSSVVLASLNSARGKGADSNIRANLANTRPQAEIVYDATGSYASVCSDSRIVAMIDSAKSASGIVGATNVTLGTAGAPGNATCHANGTIGWAIEVPLKTTPTNFACVDANGKSTITTGSTLGANDVSCN